MDIDRLRYFCALAQTGNMRRTAELLRITPPALSKAMKVLEREMGFALIAPSGRGLVITERGRRLAERAPRLLKEIQDLRKDEGEGSLAPDSGALRMGSFEVFTTYFLSEFMRRHFPERALLIHELIPGRIEAALTQRQIDYGITYLPVPSAELDHLEVGKIEMGIFCRSGSPLAHLDFAVLPFSVPITPLVGTPTKAQGLDGWPDDRIPRLVKYRVTLMETALEFCRRDLAVVYLPRFVARLHNQTVSEKMRLRELPLPRGMKPQKHPVYLVKRKSTLEDSEVKRVARAIRLTIA